MCVGLWGGGRGKGGWGSYWNDMLENNGTQSERVKRVLWVVRQYRRLSDTDHANNCLEWRKSAKVEYRHRSGWLLVGSQIRDIEAGKVESLLSPSCRNQGAGKQHHLYPERHRITGKEVEEGDSKSIQELPQAAACSPCSIFCFYLY